MATYLHHDNDEINEAFNGYDESNREDEMGPIDAKPNPIFTADRHALHGHVGHRYIEDQVGHELKDSARIWRVYNDESLLYDRNMVYVHRETIDILLVFAGLFSATVVTILVEITGRLEPDYEAFNTRLLTELVNQGRVNSGLDAIPYEDLELPGEFSPEIADVLTCGLWFVSLVLSLFVSLFCVVIKQWLSSYLSPISSSPVGKATTRQLRYEGLHKWKVPFIIGMLPQLLTISVLLFFVGLVIYLFTLNKAIAIAIAAMSSFMVSLYIASAIIPVFKLSCPYKTSLTSLLYRIVFAKTRVDMGQLEVDMVNEESKARETRAQCLFWLYDNTQIPTVTDLIMESLSGLYVEPISKEEEQKWELTDDHKAYERILYRRLRNRNLFANDLMDYIEAWWWSLPWDESEDLEDALDKEKIERVTRSALYLIQGGDYWKDLYHGFGHTPKKHSQLPLPGVPPRLITERTAREDEFEAFFRDKILPTFILWAKKFGDDVELRQKLVDMDRRLDPEREQWARRVREEQERRERLRHLEATQRMLEQQEQLAEAEVRERIRSDTATSRASSMYGTPITSRSFDPLYVHQSPAPITVQVPSSESGATVATPLLTSPTELSNVDEHGKKIRHSQHSSQNLTILSRSSGRSPTTTTGSQPSPMSLFVPREGRDDVERNAGTR